MGFTSAFLTSLSGAKILTETGEGEGFVLLHLQQNTVMHREEHVQEKNYSPVAPQNGPRIIYSKYLTSVTYLL